MDETYARFLRSLKLYQRSFTTGKHANLWNDFAEDYRKVSIEAFKAYVEGSHADTRRLGNLWDCLHEYCDLWEIRNICFENRYVRLNLGSFTIKPRTYYWKHSGHAEFDQYAANIKGHLDNCEPFNYSWKTTYDVSVYGVLDNGQYHAYLDLTAKYGKSHHFYLISPVAFVFMEDD